jgi:hypothetical protein
MERKYKVIVKNSANQIEVCHIFESFENAVICFNEFKQRYSFFYKITIEAILI